MLNTAAEYLFVPLPVLLIAGIWRRHRLALLLLGVPALAFIVLFGELFCPPLARPVEGKGDPLVTAMSYNILYFNTDYQAITRSIQDVSPDLVGLQELSPAGAQAIAGALEREYPYSTLQPLEPGRYAGLLSRFPIETAEWFSLPPRDIALHTTIDLEGRRVHVFVVHLYPNNFSVYPLAEFGPLVAGCYQRRAGEVTRLREEIVDLPEPVLLMCDCNLTDTSEAHARLGEFLHDSFREAGWGFGHTLRSPNIPFALRRIDYVWHSGQFVAVEAFTGQAGGSDHQPTVARLRLVEEP